METTPVPALKLAGTTRQDQMMAKAEEIEASFLAEMLSHSGLGEMTGPFGGGSGEAQFASFLRAEQARLMVERGGIGLAGGMGGGGVKGEQGDGGGGGW